MTMPAPDAFQLGAVRYYLARRKGATVADPNGSAWWQDSNRQQAVVAAVVPMLAFVAWIIYGLFNEGDGATIDDMKAAITPLVTGAITLAAIFYGRKFSFAAKTVAERTDVSLKDEAARLR
jgi:hypothetical protein